MKLIFIRHGDPNYELDTLTEKGQREAELLSERVKNWDVSAFYCSPLGRARKTAEYTLKKVGREAVVYDWLKEFYYPVKDPETGKDRIPWDLYPEYWTNIPELYDKDKWYEAAIMQTGKVKENFELVKEGLDGILKTYGYERDGGFYRFEKSSDDTIVIFCHLGVSFVMLAYLLGISPVVLWQGFFVAPTAVTVLQTEERMPGVAAFRVQVMGDTRHLSNGGEPISSSGYFARAFQD